LCGLVVPGGITGQVRSQFFLVASLEGSCAQESCLGKTKNIITIQPPISLELKIERDNQPLSCPRRKRT